MLLNFNIEQKSPVKPGVHKIGMQIHFRMTPPALNIWKHRGSINITKPTAQAYDRGGSLQSC